MFQIRKTLEPFFLFLSSYVWNDAAREIDVYKRQVDAYPDDVFQGTVKQVRLEATTTNNVVPYEVVISGNVKC